MPELRKALGPVTLWGLGVGYVISGMYFGWNLGLPLGGTGGMLAATLIVTAMYAAFAPSYAELSCAIPRAGGAFDFGLRAFGPVGGFCLGVAQLVEFLFAPPAIAAAIGAYFNVFFPALPVKATAIAAFVAFTALNMWGIRQAAAFELFVTIVAIGELVVFCAVTGPHFDGSAFVRDAWPHGWGGVFAALPFAIWFYLGIECLANAAEEARNPARDIPRGFGAALVTLVLLALAVFVCAVGVAGWEAVVYPIAGSPETSDSPLPLAMARVVGGGGMLFHLLVTVGLFGLVASFHGIILAASRATFELGRVGSAPAFLGRIHARSATPRAALAANMLVGIAAILTGRTGDIITLSCFGALVLYAGSMAALLVLRRREPDLVRPFRAPLYPALPLVALGLAIVCFGALAYHNQRVAVVFAALLTLAGLWRAISRR